jgi:hypothetical protein
MRFSSKRWSGETFRMMQRIPEIESAPKTHELISSLPSIFILRINNQNRFKIFCMRLIIERFLFHVIFWTPNWNCWTPYFWNWLVISHSINCLLKNFNCVCLFFMFWLLSVTHSRLHWNKKKWWWKQLDIYYFHSCK